MSFSEKISKNFDQIGSKYDLAAYCYLYLKNKIVNQVRFLGDYIERNEDAEINNPNFKKLDEFSFRIKKIIGGNPSCEVSLSCISEEILGLIESTEKSLEEFGEADKNSATIPFYILLGLDLYFQDYNFESRETAPLNKYYKEDCLIYVNTRESLMDKVIQNKKYPDLIYENDIRNYFKYIIILETKELPKNYGIPRLVPLLKEKSYIDQIVKSNKIKIAAIPVMPDRWFDFHIKRGASFEVHYNLEKTGYVKDRVLALLKNAIKYGANIILFPEYICNEEIQKEIGNTLFEMSFEEPEKLRSLLFVAAGSGWTEDSDNVGFLYSYDGVLLGREYKYSAFDNAIEGKKMIERLNNPGKEITLIKIPQIGIAQMEICRNVSENEFCRKISKVFNSQFLLITAWSKSVNIGFKKQIDSIIAGNHKTCAIMCNCCAAVGKNRRTIGIAAAPQKNGSLVEGHYKTIERKNSRCQKCCAGGCFFEIVFDFNGAWRKNVGIANKFLKCFDIAN